MDNDGIIINSHLAIGDLLAGSLIDSGCYRDIADYIGRNLSDHMQRIPLPIRCVRPKEPYVVVNIVSLRDQYLNIRTAWSIELHQSTGTIYSTERGLYNLSYDPIGWTPYTQYFSLHVIKAIGSWNGTCIDDL